MKKLRNVKVNTVNSYFYPFFIDLDGNVEFGLRQFDNGILTFYMNIQGIKPVQDIKSHTS